MVSSDLESDMTILSDRMKEGDFFKVKQVYFIKEAIFVSNLAKKFSLIVDCVLLIKLISY